MKWFSGMQTSASGMTSERLRMDVIANNIANVNTTRDASGAPNPYRRQMVVLGNRPSFAAAMSQAQTGFPASATDGEAAPADPYSQVGRGVRVLQVVEDQRAFKLKYDPTHPDADSNGWVRLPNVDTVTEMVDLISASRAYEANVTAMNAFKSMVQSALQIGK
ncbi:MAG TPA: flagellar basal body rod protein FlgC [Symbiobacteriaceae bacterium]|nr:flagellar basal body rod protein FlgC [Symbiobacteriaceae bacterium]